MSTAEELENLERLFCLTLVYAGCRISEALALSGENVLPGDGMLVIESLKKRRKGIVRRVPVPSWLLDELSQLGGKLFPWKRTKAWEIVKSVMLRTDVHPAQAMPKALRHTFGVHALQSGVPVHLVQRWLGHARLETTAIYLDVTGEEERGFAEKMW